MAQTSHCFISRGVVVALPRHILIQIKGTNRLCLSFGHPRNGSELLRDFTEVGRCS
ncbi:hypothetical protein VFPPC_17423 [Pochonia chlamydosporia 170]|uniref:Uncharacterized protein n=1 Tax=Pochonia chlamydosporia 170 TaxID=1380566 RepID=A0A219ARN1_METCM|nr:hypothetical protein VFPPC_17423 [Pochonia chlamydosporia 170]OWT43428.1 hypothetical protein VFPPC_17423 [Pochonia chlamydosporia 170]